MVSIFFFSEQAVKCEIKLKETIHKNIQDMGDELLLHADATTSEEIKVIWNYSVSCLSSYFIFLLCSRLQQMYGKLRIVLHFIIGLWKEAVLVQPLELKVETLEEISQFHERNYKINFQYTSVGFFFPLLTVCSSKAARSA